MKQPVAILVLPVFYQNLPVSAILVQILVNTSIFQNFSVSAILEDTGHCQNMSIADTRRFWEILVIPVLQILEDSGKYWLYQYCRYLKIRYEVAECTCILSNSIQCSDQSTFSITGPFQGHQYYSKRK